MTISIIAAVSRNNVIGRQNRLPWRLPADLKYFKQTTLGHHVIMGRKTFESMNGPLPGRTNIIITRQKKYKAPGCITAHSLEEAIASVTNDGTPFICGGAEVYITCLAFAGKMYITWVDEDFEGDAFFPAIDMKQWKETARKDFSRDEKNVYSYSFCEYTRIRPLSASWRMFF